MSKHVEIIICQTCRGMGNTRESIFEGHSRGWETQEIECPDCKGSGRKKRITIIEEIIFKPQKI